MHRLQFTQGVPTMRGDFEILAYNLIHWAGGDLPWETNKLLGSPPKVQQAKEDFMKSVESSVKQCFAVGSCPGKIVLFFSLRKERAYKCITCFQILFSIISNMWPN